MAEGVYILCSLTSITCALLLFRGYRANRSRLLFWAGLCFLLLALDNVLLFVDMIVLPPSIGIFWYRTGAALAGMLVLVFGLTWETR